MNKIDDNYTRLFARVSGYRDGSTFSREIKLHQCSQEEYDSFYEIENNSAHLLQQLKTNANRGMQCIDWDAEDINFFGDENTFEHAIMELFLLPCQHTVDHLVKD